MEDSGVVSPDAVARLIVGDCVEVMREMPEASVDAVVCDPPYGLKFMGKAFDDLGESKAMQVWHETWAREALRVLKAGGHLLAFGGTRTFHRLMCAIEDAGFDMRDTISGEGVLRWYYGSGFPKSLNVGKQLDKMAGAEREVVGRRTDRAASPITDVRGGRYGNGEAGVYDGSAITAPATEEAERWDGWGTALKPSWEPVVCARKPLSESTVAKNVLKHGTGAINVDATRVQASAPVQKAAGAPGFGTDRADNYECGTGREYGTDGRWPPNTLLSHSPGCVRVGERRVKSRERYSVERSTSKHGYDGGWKKRDGMPSGYADADGMETVEAWECVDGCAVREMGEQSGTSKSNGSPSTHNGIGYGSTAMGTATTNGVAPSQGTAARFFPNFAPEPAEPGFRYQSKASRRERNQGLEGMPEHYAEVHQHGMKLERWPDGTLRERKTVKDAPRANMHPTVKPLALMDWLVKLVTPPNGTILDPFAGSGSTGCSAVRLGFSFVGIEKDEEYAEIARRRIEYWQRKASETLFA